LVTEWSRLRISPRDRLESELLYDTTSRHLTVVGGSRRDAAIRAALRDIQAVLGKADEPLTGQAIELIMAGRWQRQTVKPPQFANAAVIWSEFASAYKARRKLTPGRATPRRGTDPPLLPRRNRHQRGGGAVTAPAWPDTPIPRGRRVKIYEPAKIDVTTLAWGTGGTYWGRALMPPVLRPPARG
jgi:hypothetical protein